MKKYLAVNIVFGLLYLWVLRQLYFFVTRGLREELPDNMDPNQSESIKLNLYRKPLDKLIEEINKGPKVTEEENEYIIRSIATFERLYGKELAQEQKSNPILASIDYKMIIQDNFYKKMLINILTKRAKEDKDF